MHCRKRVEIRSLKTWASHERTKWNALKCCNLQFASFVFIIIVIIFVPNHDYYYLHNKIETESTVAAAASVANDGD